MLDVGNIKQRLIIKLQTNPQGLNYVLKLSDMYLQLMAYVLALPKDFHYI